MTTCTHDLATKETACADGMCPLCLAAELAEMKKDLAKCFLELSECGSETFADELAEKYFDTWNEIRELVKGQTK